MKVALIGPYPPPYGGISVAIQRLQGILQERGIDCHVYDTSPAFKQAPGVRQASAIRRWLLQYWLTAHDNIIHYQGSSWKLRVWLGLLPWRGAKTIVSVQGSSLVDSWSQGGRLRRALIRAALRRTSFVILSNPEYSPLVRSIGIADERMAVIPAFIPPLVRKEDAAQIPAEVWRFCGSHSPLLLATGAVAFYRGDDLYGVDLMIQLIQALKPSYPQIGLVMPLRPISGPAEQEHWESLLKQAAEHGLDENICWIPGGVPVLQPLMSACDLFLRPTSTDGDSVSVREALHFRVPVVASDAAPRPEGTVLFRNRDIDDLIAQAGRILAGDRPPGPSAATSPADQILEIYHRLVAAS
jgi:glycosyltransferase involved in cell wall biosynthesis